ncbi:MAG TPA: hypothetical protein VK694_03650 [Verrucomicrobiae bacterium]|nr:hypothetical protein [Verrucomicrobiae bacterium]
MENLSPAELANRVKSKKPAKEMSYDQGVHDLVEAAGRVRKWLHKGKFEQTPEGYLKVDPIDTSDYDYPGCIIGEVEIRFVDTSGYSVRLGGIGFSSAEVNISPNETEPLYPSDERWDAVVGAIGRAIVECQGKGQKFSDD